MQKLYFKSLDSTQLFLKNKLQNEKKELCVYTKNQNAGIGSRGNSWSGREGNLYFSFSLFKSSLPKDVALQSLSIYFAMIFRLQLESKGSKCWLKWPNDFYLGDKKIGGIITQTLKDIIIIGIGINIVYSPLEADVLDIDLDIKKTIYDFVDLDFKNILWKDIFSKFMLDFDKAKDFKAHVNGKELLLCRGFLNDDGSLNFENQRVYSTR